MKTKFEANVAQEMPKTRMSTEPGLPWKLNPEDLEKVSLAKDDYKTAVTGTPPLRTRPAFLIVLLALIFITVMYFVSLMVTDNENAHSIVQKTEASMATLQTTMEKINNDKNVLSENIGQLEKRVGELNAQKELFATVIESLTKKADEMPVQGDQEKQPQQEAVNAQNAASQTAPQTQQ